MEIRLLFFVVVLIVGIILFRVGNKRRTIRADRGGVAVGGDNKGTIQTGKGKGSNALIVIGLLLQLIGILAALYTAFVPGLPK
ncbi:MAG: hypothetical protein J5I92_07910 [Thiogranum sp.]|nr:hypothetical protein [Thiogranum sp.]